MEKDEIPNASIYARVLRRAAETVGGIEALAEELNVSVAALQWWLDARDVPPHEIFAAALSIDALGPYYTRGSNANL